MMLTYRRIETEKAFIKQIWDAEQGFPQWWRDASSVWCPTYESFELFWGECGEIHGLFDGERLVACVYLEKLTTGVLNVHISVLEKTSNDDLVRFFSSLRRLKTIEGAPHTTGWVLGRNKYLLNLVKQAGYMPTGLKMSYGASHGKALQWLEVRG